LFFPICYTPKEVTFILKKYTYKNLPLKVFGLPFFYDNYSLERLPSDLRDKVSDLDFLGRRSTGVRIGFRTDATEFTVELSLKTLSPDVGMSIYACQSAEVLIGDRSNYKFAGLVNPASYDNKVFSKTFKKSNAFEDVLIFLPRNEIVENISVTFPDEATVKEPTPYKYGPILFYGSSITEGAHASRPSNSYISLLSNRLDFDFYNLGFSGSAKGEIEIADYINTTDFNVFVMDYDHNAPTPEFLKSTHKPFFMRIREKNPDLPIIIMSKPDFNSSPADIERRNIIYNTYRDAINQGDRNVYFIDGESFYGADDRGCCSSDTIHPNDLGFYRMANTIEPILKTILEDR